MTTSTAQIVQKLWNYCDVLRDDGLSYGDYVEQLTYLLFLKMAHERTQPPWSQPSAIPSGYDWPALASRDGDALEAQYRHTLETLGRSKGMLGITGGTRLSSRTTSSSRAGPVRQSGES